jgi:hypothetical protein
MKHKRVLIALAALLVFITSNSSTVFAQNGDDGVEEKSIKSQEYLSNRPKSPAPMRRISTDRYKPKKTTPTVVPATPPKGMVFSNVGLTIWRFRPATAADRTKELVEEEGDTPAGEYALERIEEGTLLAPGQLLRLSIESLSKDGYLYVISREQYSDGSTGEPRLLFPSKTNGANQVKAGKLVYIPNPPRRFRIRPSTSQKNHVAELLTIIVSPKPLVDAASVSTTAVTRAQVDGWEKQFTNQTTRFEMEGGAGRTMTEREQAAAVGSSDLNQDDPAPQTVFRLTTQKDSTLLVNVPLRFVAAKQ